MAPADEAYEVARAKGVANLHHQTCEKVMKRPAGEQSAGEQKWWWKPGIRKIQCADGRHLHAPSCKSWNRPARGTQGCGLNPHRLSANIKVDSARHQAELVGRTSIL